MTEQLNYLHLFAALWLGHLTLKNRIIFSGHDTVMAEASRVTDRLIAYQAARVRGGVGPIVNASRGRLGMTDQMDIAVQSASLSLPTTPTENR